MGLCKCHKKKVTNLFCFEHRVNVCEYCLVENHPKVWSIFDRPLITGKNPYPVYIDTWIGDQNTVVGPYRVRRFMILCISCCRLFLLLLSQCSIYVYRIWIFPVTIVCYFVMPKY